MSNSNYRIVHQIDADRTHGASQLAVMGLAGLKTFAATWQGNTVDAFCHDLQVLLDDLRSVRPSMIAIANLVNGFQDQFQHLDKDNLSAVRESVINVADKLREAAIQASQQTALAMAELVDEHDVLMTHSLSSMIKRVFTLVSDRSIKAVVTESRPGDEGALLAQFLSSLEIETCYITDAQIGLWVPRADKIIIGADSILADGAVVNKSGTLLLALVAAEYDIPVYVCCESFKWTNASRYQIEL
jgi:translation initiation factor eIF-2B subunit delta